MFGDKDRKKGGWVPPNGLDDEVRKLADAAALRDIARLEARLDRLARICHALWDMLRERGLSEEDLMGRVKALEEAPGEPCPSCGRILNRRDRRCLYCGVPAPARGVFDNL